MLLPGCRECWWSYWSCLMLISKVRKVTWDSPHTTLPCTGPRPDNWLWTLRVRVAGEETQPWSTTLPSYWDCFLISLFVQVQSSSECVSYYSHISTVSTGWKLKTTLGVQSDLLLWIISSNENCVHNWDDILSNENHVRNNFWLRYFF